MRTCLLYQLYTTPVTLVIPDTYTLHCNDRNIPTHTQGPQNPAAPIAFNLPAHPFSCPWFFLLPPYL
jgi:hypothetical protein